MASARETVCLDVVERASLLMSTFWRISDIRTVLHPARSRFRQYHSASEIRRQTILIRSKHLRGVP